MAHHRPARRFIPCLVAALVLAVGILGIAGPASARTVDSRPGPAETAVRWRQVDAGRSHTCALRSDGRLYCWGWDHYGQLGNRGTDTYRSTPVEVAGHRTDWATVSTGDTHTCARTTDRHLYCWGGDHSGQLGNGGTNTDQPTPVQVVGNRADWATVTASGSNTCARTTDRHLHCWGSDYFGQLGDGGTDTDQPAPVEVAGNRADWATVTAGGTHTCARTTDRHLYCWGRDIVGQLGDGGTDTNQPAPVEVAGNRADWATVSAGASHTCARTTDHRLYCWGADLYGELGDSAALEEQPAPVEVAGNRTDWTSVSAGGDHTCGRRTNGRLYCWGSDFSGKLGDDVSYADQPTPVQVAGNRTDWATTVAGINHSCGRRADGRLYCWGRDSYGQLGDGRQHRGQPTPVAVVEP